MRLGSVEEGESSKKRKNDIEKRMEKERVECFPKRVSLSSSEEGKPCVAVIM